MKYLNQFLYVLEVVKTRSVTLAADNLKLTQPALSKYLKKLESELGIEIFDRSANPISLTDAGERYVEAAQRIIDTDKQLSKQLEQIRKGHNAYIHVGISPSRAPYLLPNIIKSFRTVDRQTRIIIDECGTKELKEKLSCGDLDLIISINDEDMNCFMRTELFNETIMLAVPEKLLLQFNRGKPVPLGDTPETYCDVVDILRTLPIISSGRGQKMWEILNEIITPIGVEAPPIECQNMATAISLVHAGVGIMLVPSYMKRKKEFEFYASEDKTNSNDSVCFLPLNLSKYPSLSAEVNRKVCLFYRKEQFLSKSEKRFIQCAVEVVGNE